MTTGMTMRRRATLAATGLLAIIQSAGTALAAGPAL
ncbi:hypothetical protein BH24ACT22_BH24ACT22_21530 [soil metagenome]